MREKANRSSLKTVHNAAKTRMGALAFDMECLYDKDKMAVSDSLAQAFLCTCWALTDTQDLCVWKRCFDTSCVLYGKQLPLKKKKTYCRSFVISFCKFNKAWPSSTKSSDRQRWTHTWTLQSALCKQFRHLPTHHRTQAKPVSTSIQDNFPHDCYSTALPHARLCLENKLSFNNSITKLAGFTSQSKITLSYMRRIGLNSINFYG